MTAFDLIRAERDHQRQLGFTAAHDHQHTLGELTEAACSHLAAAQDDGIESLLRWPWGSDTAPEIGARLHHLVKAAALVIAEIERQRPELAEVTATVVVVVPAGEEGRA